MNELDGLDILADAFVLLKQRGTVPNLKLRIGGGYMSPDRKLVKQVKRTLKPYADDVVIEDTYDMDEHAGFYRKITVLSVPLRFQEGVGLYLCEAFTIVTYFSMCKGKEMNRNNIIFCEIFLY